MPAETFRTSKPDRWNVPHQVCEARRQHIFGKIRPMEPEGWAISFGTALAGFALRPLRVLRRSGACRYRKRRI
jgi:hypothetical protein